MWPIFFHQKSHTSSLSAWQRHQLPSVITTEIQVPWDAAIPVSTTLSQWKPGVPRAPWLCQECFCRLGFWAHLLQAPFGIPASPLSPSTLPGTPTVGANGSAHWAEGRICLTCSFKATWRCSRARCLLVLTGGLVCHGSHASLASLQHNPACFPAPTRCRTEWERCAAGSSLHIPTRIGWDSSTMRQFQENESSALSLLSILVISEKHHCSRNRLPYQSDIHTKPFLKGSLLHALSLIGDDGAAEPCRAVRHPDTQEHCPPRKMQPRWFSCAYLNGMPTFLFNAMQISKKIKELNQEGGTQANAWCSHTSHTLTHTHTCQAAENQAGSEPKAQTNIRSAEMFCKILEEKENVTSQFMTRWTILPFYSDLQNRYAGKVTAYSIHLPI